MEQPVKMSLKKEEEGYTLTSILKCLSPSPSHSSFPPYFLFFFLLPPVPCHISFLTDFLAFQNISFFLFSLLMPHNYNSLFHLHSNDSIFFSFFLSSLPCLLSHLFSFSFFSHDSSISGLNDGSLVILRTSRNTTSISIAGIRP